MRPATCGAAQHGRREGAERQSEIPAAFQAGGILHGRVSPGAIPCRRSAKSAIVAFWQVSICEFGGAWEKAA